MILFSWDCSAYLDETHPAMTMDKYEYDTMKKDFIFFGGTECFQEMVKIDNA